MRQIGTISTEADASAVADYLFTLGIKTQCDHLDQGWRIWVYDEDRVADAKREVELFLQNPTDPKYAQAGRESQRLREEAVQRELRLRKNVVDVRKNWARPGISRRPITFALIVISSATALLTRFGDDNQPLIMKLSIASYVVEGGYIRYAWLADIRHGEVWRLFTPMFLHFSIWHLLFNMFCLADLGAMIETNRGSWRFLLMVLVLAAASNLGQYAMHGPQFGGMSGVDYGLLGYLWMKGKFDPAAGMGLHPNTVVFMLGWLVLCMAGAMGPIANWAHGVGLVAGMAIGSAPALWRRLFAGDR